MKYRILELSIGFFAQERKSLFSRWKFIDRSGTDIWIQQTNHALLGTFNEAVALVEARREYLKRENFKKIHNL